MLLLLQVQRAFSTSALKGGVAGASSDNNNNNMHRGTRRSVDARQSVFTAVCAACHHCRSARNFSTENAGRRVYHQSVGEREPEYSARSFPRCGIYEYVDQTLSVDTLFKTSARSGAHEKGGVFAVTSAHAAPSSSNSCISTTPRERVLTAYPQHRTSTS